MMKRYICILAALCAIAACTTPKNGEYTIHLLTTNDVHGRYFDSLYVEDAVRASLINISAHVDSLRTLWGEENVVLIDAGDCLQGDNASFYFNFIDTVSTHLFARMVDYIGYDAVVVGNHDIETGHPVYDRVEKDMKTPFLAANAISETTGKSYFKDYAVLKKGGLKVAVIGFTNANIRNWLSPKLWSGMDFRSLVPMAQEVVDQVRTKEKPDVVIVATHSGTGRGDGSLLESQGMDLFSSLSGVDFVVCAHDHRPLIHQNDSICLVNSGSHCMNLGHGQITLEFENGVLVDKSISGSLIPVDKNKADVQMRNQFYADYKAIKGFTTLEVGTLKTDLVTSDAYKGMSEYLNLLHTLSLGCTPAQLSLAAPLTFNGYVKAGTILFNDLFTIYPYENQLYVIRMTGKEFKDCLEYSYEKWINTVATSKDHVLKIIDRADPRTGQQRWSFANRSYNFDSAGGLFYEVDVTKPYGSRVSITTLADGSAFDEAAEYNVAVTSYRANGGGGILGEGAGIDTGKIDERVVEYYPEIRDLLYDYLLENKVIDPVVTGNSAVIGGWKFVPEKIAVPALERDMELLFARR
jgi:2',3'-cyclic-nucleotide 2'-phosphodiesterase/3'-nucleotidase